MIMQQFFEQLFSTSDLSLTPLHVCEVVAAALLLGFLISIVYIFTHRRDGWLQSFAVTLIMLPAIIAIIIMLVGNSAARALSLAGAFSLVRFRSAPGDPKDIAYVFFSLSVGLACGIGYIAYGFIFAVILCAVMLLLDAVRFARPKNTAMTLKITVPENMNFQNAFDDILTQYTNDYVLKRVKTADFGSLFELVYKIELKKNCDQKEMIDAIRARNGNLTVQLTLEMYEDRNYAV